LSRELATAYTISFIISICLVLLIVIQTFNVTGAFSPWDQNTKLEESQHIHSNLTTEVQEVELH